MRTLNELTRILGSDEWALTACLQMQSHAHLEGKLGIPKRTNPALEDLIYVLHEVSKVPYVVFLTLYEEAYDEGLSEPASSPR